MSETPIASELVAELFPGKTFTEEQAALVALGYTTGYRDGVESMSELVAEPTTKRHKRSGRGA